MCLKRQCGVKDGDDPGRNTSRWMRLVLLDIRRSNVLRSGVDNWEGTEL